MKLTRSTAYAIAAATYIAGKKPSSLVPAKNIAEHYQIPLDYLLKILQHLVHAGILRSSRGPQGGFTLARATDNISLGDIIQAVEGARLVDVSAFPDPDSPIASRLNRAYSKATQLAENILEQTTLNTLIGRKKTAKTK